VVGTENVLQRHQDTSFLEPLGHSISFPRIRAGVLPACIAAHTLRRRESKFNSAVSKGANSLLLFSAIRERQNDVPLSGSLAHAGI
jgi:hypothetical protein